MACNTCGQDDCNHQSRLLKQNLMNEVGYIGEESETLTYDQIEFLLYNLPAVKGIVDGMIDYIFAGKLTVQDDNNKEVDGFESILNTRNVHGQTLKAILRELTFEMMTHGGAGVRKVGDSVVVVPKDNYDMILVESEDYAMIYEPLIYLIRRVKSFNRKLRRFEKDKPIIDNRFTIDENGNVVSIAKDWLALTNEDFINLSLDDSLTGMSPFEYDRKRVHLVLIVLDYFIHDFQRNGVGTLVFKYNETLANQLLNANKPATSTQIFDSSATNARFNKEKQDEDKRTLADELAKIEYNDSIIYSDVFSEFQQLTRDSKPSDFLDLLENYAVKIMAQVFDVSPQVFDFETTGNVGKDEIIKTFVKRKIWSYRELLQDKYTRILHLLGYENYHFAFINEEEVDYRDYDQDAKILANYQTLKELGKEEEAELYLQNKLRY